MLGPPLAAAAPAAAARAPAEPMLGFLALGDLVGALSRHRRLAAGVLLLTLIPVAVATFLETPMYEATSTLLVKLGRESVYRSDVGDQREMVVNRDRESVMNSELQILRSREVVEGVIETLGVDVLDPSLRESTAQDVPLEQVAVERFQGNYAVKLVPKTEVIEVSFLHPDPVVAAKVVNLAIDRFKERHLAAFSESDAVGFLEAKVSAYRDELAASEDRLKTFEAQHPAFSLRDPGEYILRQRMGLESSLRDVHGQVAALQLQRADETPAIAQARTRLLELELKEQSLLGRYKDTSRSVTSLREEIAQVRRALERQQAEFVRRQAAEARPLEERKADIEAQLAALEDELQQLATLSQRYRDLRRERDANEEEYKTYSKKLEDARVSGEMDDQKIANISVIQAAIAPLEPATPRTELNLAAGFAIGATLGLLAAYLADSLAPGRRTTRG
jgi:uncharacterized protein involved in exopolysaccharide biosynthesis